MPSTNGHGSSGATAVERVALYMRVSSEEQKTKESIETQEGFLEDYCKLYGHGIAGVYKDEAISGTVPMRERPGGRRLLEDAKAGAFDVVLSYKLDRIGRSLLVVVDTHDRLQEASVSLRSATEPIDTSTPAGRLIFQMLASFAEFERATITERSRDGLHRAFKKGVQLGRIPYGYDIDEAGAFVVVEEEARLVREIFARVAAGSTLYGEAKRLNDESEPSPGVKYRGRARKPGASWCPSTVRNIIHQRAYVGTHVVKAHKGPVEREVPAVVESEIRDRALGRLKENKRYSGGKTGRQYLLRGLVFCAYHRTVYVGDPSISSMGYRYYYYGCRKKKERFDKRLRDQYCPKVQAGWLEDLVWTDVRMFLNDPGEVLERVRGQLANQERGEDLQERYGSLTERLAAKEREKDRYVKLYAGGHLDEDELEVYLADLKNQLGNLKLLIGSVEADMARQEQDRQSAWSTEAWLMTLRKNLAEIEQDTEEALMKRHELVKLLVEKITVGKAEDGRTKVEITYRFGPPAQGVSADGKLKNVGGSLNSERVRQGARTRGRERVAYGASQDEYLRGGRRASARRLRRCGLA